MKKHHHKREILGFVQFLGLCISMSLRSVQCFPPSSLHTSAFASQGFVRSAPPKLRLQERCGISPESRIRHLVSSFSQLHSTDPNNVQGGENTNSEESSSPNLNEDRDLYTILNASPTDSTQTLKQKYRVLARQTHPDALIGNEDDSEYLREQAAIQFAEITAAYKTLSDPKTRLQYDRSLKAKEFTDNVVDSLEGGMRASFETAYQTAGTIRSVGQQIDKAREETAYRLELASKISQYRTQSKALKLRSQQEANRQVELQQKLDDPKRRKRHPYLEQAATSSYKPTGTNSFFPQSSSQSMQNQEFTSNLANEIARNLQQSYQTSNNNNNGSNINFGDPAAAKNNGKDDNGMEETLIKAIDRLSQIETDMQDVTKTHQESQREMAMARTQLDRIQEQEQRALQALEAAQAAYEAAKKATKEQEEAYGDVLKQERVSYSKVEQCQSALSKQQDRTKDSLRRTEDLFIWKENSYLREEARKAKSLSAKLQEKSEELQKKADELKQELDSI